jgi:hypothetical protein
MIASLAAEDLISRTDLYSFFIAKNFTSLSL